MSRIHFVDVELLSSSFKRLGAGKTNTKSKFIQKYEITSRKQTGSDGYVIIKIYQYMDPTCLFKAQVELKVNFELLQESDSEILYGDEFQQCLDDNIGRIFGENSHIMAFLTDRAFGSPLILPPFPDSDDDEDAEGK